LICPLQSFGVSQVEDAASLPLLPPLWQLASPTEYIRITGSASSVQHSPRALSRYTVLQGLPDNSLRSSWVIRISPLMNFRSASEFNLKAAGGRTVPPLFAC
jgi:hypothetical protein